MADSWGRRVSKGCPHETLVPVGWRACGHTRGGQMGSTAAVELSPTQWHRSLFGVLYSAQVFTHRPQRTSLLPGATGSGAPLPSPALALVSVVLAEDPVVLQVEEVAHTEPVLALSARKALQVVDIGAGPHDHLEGRNHLVAGSTESRAPEQSVGGGRGSSQWPCPPQCPERHSPQVVSFAEQQVALCVQSGGHLPQATVTAAAPQTVLVPRRIQSPQEELLLDLFPTAHTLVPLLPGHGPS